MPNRREVLAGCAAGLAVSAAPSFVRAQAAALAAADLGSGLAVISGAGANVVARFGASGTLLVDGGSAARAQELLALVAERNGDRPVHVSFNTNWRDEHVGANATLGRAGAKILAHENTKLWLGADFFVDWEDRQYLPRPAEALPNTTFYESGAVDFDGRAVEYRYLPRAHTDGDVAVFFPDANVLAASSVLAVETYPVVDYATGGWIGGLEAATKTLLAATDAHTRIVPARGAVCGRRELEAQLALCTAVRERVAESFRRGMSFDEFVATGPTREFDTRRGDPKQFLALVHKGAWAHLRELGGVI